MSEKRERCAVCDFPLATAADLAELRNIRLDAPCCVGAAFHLDEEHFGQRLCRGGRWGSHAGPAIDWRARALEAEARVEALEVALRGLLTTQPGTSDERNVAIARAEAALSTTPPKPAPLTVATGAVVDVRDLRPGDVVYVAPRPDATEALRVAMEAMEELAGVIEEHAEDGIVTGRCSLQPIRAALDLLRAHVEPTPLENAVKAHVEEVKP